MSKKLNEGARAGDLNFLINNKIHIDEYNSKMGKPDAVVTASFLVKQREPAFDLVSFFENGYDWILDADISTGEVKQGEYLVFLEMQRKPDIAEKFTELLEDLKNITNIEPSNWQIKWYKQENYVPFNKDMFDQIVPNSPKKYKQSIEEYQKIKEETSKLSSDLHRLKYLSGVK